ncbi:MAG: TrkH family potassium uptake protein [Bacillota bacterium]|nr:TrkH family potassium uptake protein [Bacillota bacterium]
MGACLRTFIKKFLPIGYYTGKVVLLIAGTMTVPFLTAVVAGELGVALDFLTAIGVAASTGLALLLLCGGQERDLEWSQGMVVVACSWLLVMALAALPYYLSGHWGSYLDAMFDVMSGLTTTGLVLVQDLDHLPDGINMWRHLLTWLGGQGIVVLALSLLIRSLPGAFKMYVGEGKDERLLPNVISTARAIWFVSLTYLLVGTAALWGAGLAIGLPPGRAFLHGLWIFMAAWSTGGFAPQSQNIIYYHSFLYELVTVVFFLIGSLNFNLHWAIWSGDRREVYRNLEAVTFAVTSNLLAFWLLWELARLHVYPDVVSLVRRGYYSLISGHTTTGFMSLYARQFILEWWPLALLAITVAMLFGGSASSTAGGFKAMRVGIAFKAVRQEVRRLLAPERAVVVEKIHLGRDLLLEDRHVRAALTIIVLYVLLWLVVAGVTAAYGYDLPSALFEAASAVGNVGLTCGVTAPGMPALVKVTYILGMWLGRLEFMAVFTLFGFFLRGWRK